MCFYFDATVLCRARPYTIKAALFMHKIQLLTMAVLLSAFTVQRSRPPAGTRLAGKHRYTILDSTGFPLYSINKLVQGEKIARPQTVYYFRVDAQGPLQELTLQNLEAAFAANSRFRYALEAQFRSDKDLAAYDAYLKTYKVEYLFLQASH